jgi:hypothetical protein
MFVSAARMRIATHKPRIEVHRACSVQTRVASVSARFGGGGRSKFSVHVQFHLWFCTHLEGLAAPDLDCICPRTITVLVDLQAMCWIGRMWKSSRVVAGTRDGTVTPQALAPERSLVRRARTLHEPCADLLRGCSIMLDISEGCLRVMRAEVAKTVVQREPRFKGTAHFVLESLAAVSSTFSNKARLVPFP